MLDAAINYNGPNVGIPSAAWDSVYGTLIAPLYSKDQTSWFDQKRTEVTRQALTYHFEMIERQKEKLCKLQFDNSYPSFFVSVGEDNQVNMKIDQYNETKGQAPNNTWGDNLQTGFIDSVFMLGSYEYRLGVFSAKNEGGSVSWKANIQLIDILGWQEHYASEVPVLGHFKWIVRPFVGYEREIVRGSWNLEGKIDCCK